MSAPRSKAVREAKRFGSIMKGYQAKIDRQALMIERLVKGMSLYQDTLHRIMNAETHEEALAIANEGSTNALQFLAAAAHEDYQDEKEADKKDKIREALKSMKEDKGE
jgi:hypothetical protein